MRLDTPRLVLAGTNSGSGKTTMTMAILQALVDGGEDVQAFKCGPDYIDPMFHSAITGHPAANVDLFFTDAAIARRLFANRCRSLNIVEGVMGYYDGLSIDSDTASTWAVADALNAPAVLILNARGLALSAAAIAQGFQSFKPKSHIRGVLLNNVSPMVYPSLKSAIERETGLTVYGYLPKMPEAALESRHLGLVTAEEVQGLREKLKLLADAARKSIDLPGLTQLMRSAEPINVEDHQEAPLGSVRIAIARDEAFCFYYQEDLDLLASLGATLIPFSPLRDHALPDADGLLLGGGYPELHAEALEANDGMLASIRQAIQSGLPTIAECGGFMYLTERIESHTMVGLLPGGCAPQGRLIRFGYATIRADADNLLLQSGEEIRGHEFHYWDSSDPGQALTATKPSGRTWKCGHVTDALYAGYPHLSLVSNPNAARRFILKCLERNNAS